MSLFGDLNEVKLLGNITQDIELRFTPSGAAVANFSIATNRRFKQGEEWKDESEFHNIVVWSNLAQQLAQRAKKGTRVMVVGRLQTRSWEQEGQKKYKTEIVADDVFLIDRYERGKSDTLAPVQAAGGNSDGYNGMSQTAPVAGNPSAAPATSKSAKKPATDSYSGSTVDPDDLPF